MEKNINETEELAQSEPLSVKDKIKIAVIALAVICVIGAVIFGVLLYLRAARTIDAAVLLSNTAKSQNAAFSGQVKTDKGTTDLKGVIYRTDSGIKAACDIDYGNRAVLLQLQTIDDDAYVYIESEQDAFNLHMDISGANAFSDKKTDKADWESILKNASTEEINLAESLNAEKLPDAVADIKSRIQSPFEMLGMLNCSKKDDVYTIETDMYKLMTFASKSAKDIFTSENGYSNLKKEIENQKEDLKKQTVTITIKDAGGYAGDFGIDFGGENPLTVTLSFTGINEQTEPEYEANPEICETVSLIKAYRTLLRSGLDVGSAQKEASMSLNAFSEFYKHSVVKGTIVVVYDEYGNDFRFIYTDKNKLEEIDYEAAEYSAWADGGYVLLDTSNLDSGKYKVAIYEPGLTMRGKTEANDYNDAYLAALNACYQISNCYSIPEGAIFLVKQNGTDFQFSYSGGNLYDVYEQYYYMIYTDSYGPANISDAEDVPTNVTMYIPDVKTDDK